MVSPAGPTWLGRASYFRTVSGAQPALHLLNDPRMHANLAVIFEGLGLTSGPLWEITNASLLNLNGEEHRQYRALIAPWFTPRAVEWMRPHLAEEAHRRIDSFVEDGSCEFIGDFASAYIALGTCRFAGFPIDEADQFLPPVEIIAVTGYDIDRLDECAAALTELTQYARSILERRTTEPTDDVLSRIAEAVRRGNLPEPVGAALVATLLSAGVEPTTKQVGLTIEVLSEHPALWDAVGTGERDPAPVIEEILRFRGTNRQISRKVAESFEYDGVSFSEGEHVIVKLGEANHDPCRYANPDELDLDANRASHLAFGFGPHYCLGAALARIQLQEALRALASRVRCPTIVESLSHEGQSLDGPYALTISFTPRSTPS